MYLVVEMIEEIKLASLSMEEDSKKQEKKVVGPCSSSLDLLCSMVWLKLIIIYTVLQLESFKLFDDRAVL